MATRESKLTAVLVDGVSANAARIQASLKGVGEAGRKAIGDRDSILGARGAAAVIERAKKVESGVGSMAARYQLAASAGRAHSASMAATTSALVAQNKALATAGKNYEAAAAKARTYFRATSAGGLVYGLDRLAERRAARLATPTAPLPPTAQDTARAAARNKRRAAEWVAEQNARRAADAAVSGGIEDPRGRRLRHGLAGGLGGGLSANAAWRLMTNSADEERAMRQTAVTAGAAESEIAPAIARLKALQQKWATPYKEIKEDFDELIVMGRTWAQALRDIEGLTMARRAYGAGFGRLQTLVGENFDMTTPEQQQKALQIIAGAGKSGRFEIGDFTRRFPKLAPLLKSAGFKGEKGLTTSAAMMQILADRFGTADQAAVGMENLLGEFVSPVTKRRMGKQGINVDKIIADAERKGQNGFEAILKLLQERTGGDERKLGEFFRNKNSLQAVGALVSNYAKIAEKIREAERNAETAMRDDATRFTQDSKAKLDALSNAVKDAGGLMGSFLSDHLTPFIERVANGMRNLMGQSLPDKEKLEFLKKQEKEGSFLTRWAASRGISAVERRLGIGRDFTLSNPGHGLSPTGVASDRGGDFRDGNIRNRLAARTSQEVLRRSPLPAMHSGGALTPASLYSGALSPEPTAATPMVRPKVDTSEVSKAQNAFEVIKGLMDTIGATTVTPSIGTGQLERAHQLLREFINDLGRAEAGVGRLSGAAQRATQSVRTAVRAAYSDYGTEVSG